MSILFWMASSDITAFSRRYYPGRHTQEQGPCQQIFNRVSACWPAANGAVVTVVVSTASGHGADLPPHVREWQRGRLLNRIRTSVPVATERVPRPEDVRPGAGRRLRQNLRPGGHV